MLPVHVVEPTLVDEAGHCAARFFDLLSSAPDLRFSLWADRRVRTDLFARATVDVQPYFFRRLRRLQAAWLYRRLLRTAGTVYVPTAGYFDLRALDLAAGRPLGAHKALLYFHKFNPSPRRAANLRRLALRQPALSIFATTDEIAQRFRSAGWRDVHVALPEPVSLNVPPASGFVHLLSAGAARADKGFEHIVALAEVLAADVDATAPALVVQASGDHYGRYDSATSALLERLQRLPAQRVRVIRAPVPLQEYARLFEGSICLQPYRPHDYADKVSGITLDALRAGAPIITTANTWMARIVEDTGAGEVVTTTDPSTLLAAADRLRADYPQFQQRALRASARLSAQAGLAPLAAALRAAAAAAVQP